MAEIKLEIFDEISPNPKPKKNPSSSVPASVIDLSSSDSDYGYSSGSDDDLAGDSNKRPKKKKKVEHLPGNVALPLGFLDPLPSREVQLSSPSTVPAPSPLAVHVPGEVALALPAPKGNVVARTEYNSKQFWKAGDYVGAPSGDWQTYAGQGNQHFYSFFFYFSLITAIAFDFIISFSCCIGQYLIFFS